MSRVKFTPYIPAATLARARNTVAALRGHLPECRSLNELVDAALREKCARLERNHHDGDPFPPADKLPGAGGRR